MFIAIFMISSSSLCLNPNDSPSKSQGLSQFSSIFPSFPLDPIGVRIVASRPSAQDMPGQRLQLGRSPPSSPGNSQRDWLPMADAPCIQCGPPQL